MGEVSLEIFVRDVLLGVCVYLRKTSVCASDFASKELGVDKVVVKGKVFVKAVDGSKVFFFLSKFSPTHELGAIVDES